MLFPSQWWWFWYYFYYISYGLFKLEKKKSVSRLRLSGIPLPGGGVERISGWNVSGLVIVGARSDGLNYAAKVLRIASESLVPLNFLDLKLYLSFCIVPKLCICSPPHRATCIFCPHELKHRQGNFQGEKSKISFFRWVLRKALMKNTCSGRQLMY